MQGWIHYQAEGSGLALLCSRSSLGSRAFRSDLRPKHACYIWESIHTRQGRRCEATQRRAERYMIPPDQRFEVDEELWSLLDICSNEELEEIHKILYGRLG